MANPQPDKFTRVSTELLEAKMKYRISGEENQIWEVIIRQTFGFHKSVDYISLSQFCIKTNLKKPHVCRAIRNLLNKNMIIKKDNGRGHNYSIQKNFDKWKPLSKKVILPKLIISVAKKDNLGVPKMVHTIDTNTIDTKQKISDPVSSFFQYYLLKTKKQFKLTPIRKNLILKKLSEGYTMDELKQAVDNFIKDKWEGRADHMDLIYCIGQQKGKADNLDKWLNIKQAEKRSKYHVR